MSLPMVPIWLPRKQINLISRKFQSQYKPKTLTTKAANSVVVGVIVLLPKNVIISDYAVYIYLWF